MSSAPLRIVFTIAGVNPDQGGPTRSVPALTSAIADLGVAVDFVTLDHGKVKPVVPSHPGIRNHILPCSGSSYVPRGWTADFEKLLSSLIQAEGATPILHDTGLWLPTNHIAAKVAANMRVPRLVSPRGMLSSWALNHRRWKKKIAWFLYQKKDLQRASALHATAESEAEEFRACGIKTPIIVVPNGVDVPALQPKTAIPTRTALFLSRVHPKKGVLDLVQAWAQVRPDGWQLLICGPGDAEYVDRVKKAISDGAVGDSVRLVGNVPDAEKWTQYRAADLFLLPSYSENFGLVVAEAMGAGVPVITTRETPWAEVEKVRSGWWINTGVEPLVKALQEAISLPPQQLQEMGERGRTLILDKYTWSAVARQMVGFYQELLIKR